MDKRTGKLYVSVDDVPPTWKPYMVEVDPEKLTPLQRSRMRVGRNDTCPCGSGRKFKRCCLRKAK